MSVMERLQFSLEQVIHENALGKTVVSMHQRLTWLREASLGMNWLHGICKIVHRDLKRANLVLDDNPHIQVADFGFSEYLRKQAGLQDMTAPKGTVLYMAAEVMKQKEINKKADVYCFGLIVYEVLTDEELYAQFNDTLWQQLRNRPVEGDCLMLFDTVKEADGAICVDVCGLGRCLFARDVFAKNRDENGIELLLTHPKHTRLIELVFLDNEDGLVNQIDFSVLFVLIGPF